MKTFVKWVAGISLALFIFILGLYVGNIIGISRGKLECVSGITNNVKDKVNDTTIKFKNTLNGLRTIIPKE